MSNINSAYFIHIMPKIGEAKAPSAPPVPTPMSSCTMCELKVLKSLQS